MPPGAHSCGVVRSAVGTRTTTSGEPIRSRSAPSGYAVVNVPSAMSAATIGLPDASTSLRPRRHGVHLSDCVRNAGPSESAGVISASVSAPSAPVPATVTSRRRVKREPLSATSSARASCSPGCVGIGIGLVELLAHDEPLRDDDGRRREQEECEAEREPEVLRLVGELRRTRRRRRTRPSRRPSGRAVRGRSVSAPRVRRPRAARSGARRRARARRRPEQQHDRRDGPRSSYGSRAQPRLRSGGTSRRARRGDPPGRPRPPAMGRGGRSPSRRGRPGCFA